MTRPRVDPRSGSDRNTGTLTASASALGPRRTRQSEVTPLTGMPPRWLRAASCRPPLPVVGAGAGALAGRPLGAEALAAAGDVGAVVANDREEPDEVSALRAGGERAVAEGGLDRLSDLAGLAGPDRVLCLRHARTLQRPTVVVNTVRQSFLALRISLSEGSV